MVKWSSGNFSRDCWTTAKNKVFLRYLKKCSMLFSHDVNMERLQLMSMELWWSTSAEGLAHSLWRLFHARLVEKWHARQVSLAVLLFLAVGSVLSAQTLPARRTLFYFCRLFRQFVIAFQDWCTNRFKCALIRLCNLSASGSSGHSLNYFLWWEFYHIEPDAAFHEIYYCA